MNNVASYVLLTDAAPLRRGGNGCQVLGRDWLDAMGDQVRLIVTHRMLYGPERARIEEGQPAPVRYYFNGAGLKLSRFPLARRCVEWLVFLLVLPGLAAAVRRSTAQRIFALSANAPGFLLFAALLSWATRLPLDLFLVDDYEEGTRRSRQHYLLPAVRFFEKRFLRRMDRVFVISRGFGDHLQAKYGQRAHWLPVLVNGTVPAWRSFQPGTPDVRDLVFVGSVNFLYEDGLVDFYQAVAAWNQRSPAYRLRLKLITRQRPGGLLRRLPSTEHLELVLDADDQTKALHVRNAWAITLPYSFATEEKVFVTTSFSYKFTDAITAGRPIVVYGPSYGSIPRYFREEGLPLQANSPTELEGVLRGIEAADRPETLALYADLLRRNHSREAIRRVLAESPSTINP